MDYGVVLTAAVLVLAAVVAGLVVWLRRGLPADVLAEIEAVARQILDTLGDLATEERVRWMAGYVYDVAVTEKSRVSREEFEALVWQAVQRGLRLQGVTEMASAALPASMGRV